MTQSVGRWLLAAETRIQSEGSLYRIFCWTRVCLQIILFSPVSYHSVSYPYVVKELQKATILDTTHISESAKCRSTEHSAWEIPLYAIYIVTTK